MSLQTDHASTDELLVRIGTGDQDAFAAFYTRAMPKVRGVCVRVLRNRNLAAEVAQEVMVEIWHKADRFDPERGTASGWISTLAHRRSVDRVRSEEAARAREKRVARREQTVAFDEVADEVERRLAHWQVRQAVAELTERQREAIELAYFSGHTYRDVAKVLGIPEGTAKSRLRDGIRRLTLLLENQL